MLSKPSKNFLLLNVSLALITVLATALIFSEITAKKYITELQSSAGNVRATVKTLESDVELPLLDDPNATSSSRAADAKKIKNAIAACRAKINDLSAESSTLPSLTYAEYIGTFAVADTLKERSLHVINQTNDTLERYDETITFLEVYATSLEKSTKIMDEFNTINDFNDYAGRSNYFRQMSSDLQAEVDTLTAVKTPAELVAIKDSAIQTLQRLSTQINNLAHGMDVAIDDIIYGSVREIEASNAQLTALVEKDYSETISQLRVVQDIYDLNEKFDLILL